jgi:DNA-binding transcriptional MerR regulator
MRQLDLFGTLTEATSPEKKPEEQAVVEEREEQNSEVAEVVNRSYSKNILRPRTLSAETAMNGDTGSESQDNSKQAVVATSGANLSLFDTPAATFENATKAPEIEIVVSESLLEITSEVETLAAESPTEVPVPLSSDESQTFLVEGPDFSVFEESEPIGQIEKIAVIRKPKKQQLPELERNGSVIFDDGKISVKIKNKSPFPEPIKREKKEKPKKIPQKRGRKSFKEIDAEVDLIEIPEDEVLFQKQYYPISEVAKWFRVNTSLLRFWENEFDVLKPRKNRKGDRMFRPEDVKNLQLIYQLLRQRKYTIEGAKEYIKTNKKKADIQLQLTNTLQKFKSFLLDMKANLPS